MCVPRVAPRTKDHSAKACRAKQVNKEMVWMAPAVRGSSLCKGPKYPVMEDQRAQNGNTVPDVARIHSGQV